MTEQMRFVEARLMRAMGPFESEADAVTPEAAAELTAALEAWRVARRALDATAPASREAP